MKNLFKITVLGILFFPVSYTHLDVYKRQELGNEFSTLITSPPIGLAFCAKNVKLPEDSKEATFSVARPFWEPQEFKRKNNIPKTVILNKFFMFFI